MEKTKFIKDKNELNNLRKRITDNLDKNVLMIRKLINTVGSVDFFEIVKYEKTVIDPLTGEPENLIEVINQSQTYLVSIMAVEYLMEKNKDISFKINFGNVQGYDIESEDGSIIAECFAATSYRSNGKLTADLKRLKENKTASYKYEFFYDKEFTESHKQYYKKNYPDIEIVKLIRNQSKLV